MNPRLAHVLVYLAALLGPPLVSAALFFWVAYIPVFALWSGGLPYLLTAGPVFAIALRRGIRPHVLRFALIGVMLNFATPWIYAPLLLDEMREGGIAAAWQIIEPLFIFGIFMSALWGAMFALLYRLFSRFLPKTEPQ